MTKTILLLVLIFSSHAFAAGLPAKRPSHVRAEDIYAFIFGAQQNKDDDPSSVFNSRRPDSKVDWSRVPQVSPDELNHYFSQTRDNRVLYDNQNRLRRVTWLYPDDGCFARAELVVNQVEQVRGPVPMKVFVFGDLNVKTRNHPSGEVSWWYHVAPVLRVGVTPFILDPAIEPKRPLPYREWVKRMHSRVEVSLCAPHAYDPTSDCGSTEDESDRARDDERTTYLPAEWDRVVELSRDPDRELGDFPPWLDNYLYFRSSQAALR